MTVGRTYMLCPIFLMVCYSIGTEISYEIDGQDSLTRPFAKKKKRPNFIQNNKTSTPSSIYSMYFTIFLCNLTPSYAFLDFFDSYI